MYPCPISPQSKSEQWWQYVGLWNVFLPKVCPLSTILQLLIPMKNFFIWLMLMLEEVIVAANFQISIKTRFRLTRLAAGQGSRAAPIFLMMIIVALCLIFALMVLLLLLLFLCRVPAAIETRPFLTALFLNNFKIFRI